MLRLVFLAIFYPYVHAQPPLPPPDIPDCSEGWQSVDINYVPTIAQCADFKPGNGIACNPKDPSVCTGRNPFCAKGDGERQFKCCSDLIQDTNEIDDYAAEQIKPYCPLGAIPFKVPQVMLCDPSIVNICPKGYECVEAANGHLLPEDSRTLCCKTSSRYSFATVFKELQLTPRLVPNPPLAAIEYTTLNLHTPAMMQSPEIRTGDHFVLSPYRLLEPAYLKSIKLFNEQASGSFLHVLMFDPLSPTESMQLYYDRPSRPTKLIDLEEPIADGGFIYKRSFRANPRTNMDNNPNIRPRPPKDYKKLWIVLVFKTVSPLTRLYISFNVDLNAKYKSVPDFLRSDTGRNLGAPVAGTYFYMAD